MKVLNIIFLEHFSCRYIDQANKSLSLLAFVTNLPFCTIYNSFPRGLFTIKSGRRILISHTLCRLVNISWDILSEH